MTARVTQFPGRYRKPPKSGLRERIARAWRAWVLLAGVLLALGAVWGGVAWQASRPISDEQAAILRALVQSVAKAEGRHPATIWADVKRPLGVNRYEDIRRGNFEDVREGLLERAGR